MMRLLIRKAKVNPDIRSLAAEIVRSVTPKDFVAEIEAVYRYVIENCRYTRDVNDVETLQPADYTARQGYGDCDDISVYIASLLESIGHPTRNVAVGFKFREYNHVYIETKVGMKWIAVDASETRGVGWAPPHPIMRMEIYNGS